MTGFGSGKSALRSVLAGLLLAIAGGIGTFPAEAASCAALTQRLAKLDQTAVSPSVRKWQAAKREQQTALSAAKRDAAHFKCGTANAAQQCDGLSSKIKRMSRNLRAIERQLTKAGGASGSARARLEKAHKAQNCGNTGSRSASRPANPLARLFSHNRPRSELTAPDSRQTRKMKPVTLKSSAISRKSGSGSRRGRLPAGGTFRTLCVRTCDGYFFPVSFKTGKRDFVNDEARCSELCPAAPTELYVHRNPGGTTETMMSLAGAYYADQPFADRYKSEYVEGCTCRNLSAPRRRSAWTALDRSGQYEGTVPQGFLQLSRQAFTLTDEQQNSGSAAVDVPRLSRAPIPAVQLPAFEDPDTQMNLRDGFDVTVQVTTGTHVQAPLAANTPGGGPAALEVLGLRPTSSEMTETAAKFVDQATEVETGKPVRVVGPEFFVAQ